MYQLACWYVETYGNDCTIKVPEYKLPELPQIDQGINEENIKTMVTELANKKLNEFMKKFDSRIVIPVFTNDELVSFAKTYAKDLGYKIDDMAVLALYTLIGDNQNEENPVTIGTVREMMDEAIKRASKKGRRLGKKVAKRHLDDESGRIMLYEKDFDI